MNRLAILSASTVLTCLFTTHARAAHVDILAYNDDGQLGTGYVDVDSGDTVTGARLFTETLSIVQPSLFGATAPGYYSNSAYPLLPSSDLSFDALAITHPGTQTAYNLMYWDGLGDVDFGAPIGGATLQFRLSSAFNISVDGSPDDVAGFVIDGTSPDGVMHKHISYSARGPGGTQPADGLYLAAIHLSMPGLADSDTVYLLFNAHYQRDAQDNIVYVGDAPQVDPASEDAAVAWIEQYLIADAIVGDLDSDGFVGITDLNIVLSAWNQSVPPGNVLADPSGDGFVGIEDLNVVLGNWNAGAPPTIVVPEPIAMSWFVLSGAMLTARRRRSWRVGATQRGR